MPRPLQKPRDPARRSTQAPLPAKVHRRAAETATSTASTESALIDFVSAHPDYDVLCLIQATSPLIVPGDFTAGWQARALHVVTATPRPPHFTAPRQTTREAVHPTVHLTCLILTLAILLTGNARGWR